MLHDENALFGIAEKPASEITENPCCKAAFLKSAFIITGSISNPEREYSVTLSLSSVKAAEHLKQLCLGEGINAGVSTNRSRYVVYIKNAESESVFLTLIGAHSARLKLENVRIMKDIKNSANRQANCDNNNIERVIKTSAAQAEDIRFLAAHVQKLPAWAREIMSLRLENPDSSLAELGEMCDPPIGKSGVNNRLRRLSEMAARLRES
jgi:DNA-binding protein WhiA